MTSQFGDEHPPVQEGVETPIPKVTQVPAR
jgi:hypothetical protein